MTVARRARQVGNLGSLGTLPAKRPLKGEAAPAVRVVAASVIYGKNEYPIWNGQNWLTKKFPARREEDATFRIFVEGAGKALVSVVFNDPNGQPCYLFVRRLGEGEHFISVQIPFAALPKFRFAIGQKADARIDTRFLSDKEVRGLTSNMLLLNDTPNAYYTDALGGFGSIGAASPSSHPGYVAAAASGNLRTASGKFKLWSGSLSSHRWKDHGYSGRKEAGRPGAKMEAGQEGPWYVCDSTGHYAFRGSTYQMTYDANGNMRGYDAMENLERGMPAGVPIAMVMQYFVHDPEGVAGAISGIGGYDNLGIGVPKWAKKAGGAVASGAKKAGGAAKSAAKTTAEYTAKGVVATVEAVPGEWAEKGLTKVGETAINTTVATGEFVVDTTKDTVEATGNFISDPSLTNAVSIVTAGAGLNSCWHYADNVTINKSKIFFLDENDFMRGQSVKQPSDKKGLITTFADASAIPYKLDKGIEVLPTFTKDGVKRNKTTFAQSVEWYNPSTKKWSKPQINPPFNVKTNSKGKIRLIFRFPRQLDPVADRSTIQSAIQNGYSNYGWDQSYIRNAYPTYSSDSKKYPGNRCYRLLGRVEGKDSDTEMRTVFSQTINGVTFRGQRSIRACLYIAPPTHKRAGFTNPANVGSMNTMEAFKVHIADPAKFTYLDNPEIDHSYYVEGEMKPGSVVVVVGKALGTVTGANCILTTRGWPTTTITNFGQKVPPGDTPAFVAQNVIQPNGSKPRKETGKEGTMRADYLELAGHITADDLLDQKLVSGEAVLRQTWQQIFGKELSADWFRQNKLQNQDPNNPLHYTIRGSAGETYSFPFSIAWFKIPKYYVGPYLDYDDTGKLQVIEGRPFAISSPDAPLFIVMATPFSKMMQQKFDIVAETKEQKALEEAGFEPDKILAINEMNYDAEDITETVEVDNREREYLQRTKQGDFAEKPKGKMVRYTDSWWDANFTYSNDDVVLREKKEPVALGAFTNPGNFYVVDETEKMQTSEPEDETPFIGFAGLHGWEEAGEFATQAGKVLAKGSTGFALESAKIVAAADLDAKEVAVLGGASALAIGAALGLGYIAVYGFPKGVGAGIGKVFEGYGRGKERKLRGKADIWEARADTVRAARGN
jgi:hypothetical protein